MPAGKSLQRMCMAEEPHGLAATHCTAVDTFFVSRYDPEMMILDSDRAPVAYCQG
jgi:hypothetical protein